MQIIKYDGHSEPIKHDLASAKQWLADFIKLAKAEGRYLKMRTLRNISEPEGSVTCYFHFDGVQPNRAHKIENMTHAEREELRADYNAYRDRNHPMFVPS